MSDFWKGKRVLVTGAGGFIGSHLVERLVQLGAEVTGVVHYNALGMRGLLDRLGLHEQQRIRVVLGDLREADSLDEAMEGQEVVFHLAAIIAIPYSYLRPEHVVGNNVRVTLNVLQAARRHKVARIVHTSSSEVYGTARTVPIDEDHPLQAQSPYAASKIACDMLAQSFHLSYDLPVVTLRPFNTFGPRQSARAIVPTIITQALTRSAVHLGNLNPARDFNYVADTVEGFILAAGEEKAVGGVINIGSGRQISVGDLAKTILALAGREVPIVCDDERIRPDNSEVECLCADNTKAREILGWHPEHSLRSGLSETIAWLEKNLEHYRPSVYAI